jgi:hypothetical protein
MNERIRELARQADAWAREIVTDLREIPIYNKIRDEKFAQLIVEECAKVCDLYAMPDGTSETAIILAYAIRRKFGVE